MSAEPGPPGLSKTFYKRQLPTPPAIEFASEQGRQVFAEALAAGTATGFFKLIEQFRTQDEPAYCGLASLAMVLNTLAIDPRRAWKGPWRVFHEEMLDCCHPLERVQREGITLQQAACLARCNGARVEVYAHGSVPELTFRAMLREACASGEEHIIVSYSRKEFLQTGDGHFSPVGAYNEREDLALILDTARFKYPPHWVRVSQLYRAMAHVDPTTLLPRGFLRMGRQPRMDSVLLTLDVRDGSWKEAAAFVERGARAAGEAAAGAPGATGSSVLAAAAAAAPLHALRTALAVRSVGTSCTTGVCTQTAAIQTFLTELRSMPLFQVVSAALPAGAGDADLPSPTQQQPETAAAASCCDHHAAQRPPGGSDTTPAMPPPGDEPAVPGTLAAERVSMLLEVVPPEAWVGIPEPLRGELLALLDTSAHSVVAIEAEYLRAQFAELEALQQSEEQAQQAELQCSTVRRMDGEPPPLQGTGGTDVAHV